ncbi:MAG: NusG domain II-containing protein [Clostridia bacterium]|nr:NusG domain II-containing protein [Clostridia bacterium]
MKKNKYKILIGICALIFALGIVGSAVVLLLPKKNTVNIVRDSKVLYTFDLSKAEDTTFDIDYNGSTNTVEIKDGKIRVLKADCPDNTCVHMGWLSSSAMPIVCLPNHLVIEFAENNSEIDAVAG